MPPATPTAIDRWSTASSSIRQVSPSLYQDRDPEKTANRPTMVGLSPAMEKVFSIIKRVAPTDASVLITGATGTGKELAARAIHDTSPRRKHGLVDINWSASTDARIQAV